MPEKTVELKILLAAGWKANICVVLEKTWLSLVQTMEEIY